MAESNSNPNNRFKPINQLWLNVQEPQDAECVYEEITSNLDPSSRHHSHSHHRHHRHSEQHSATPRTP